MNKIDAQTIAEGVKMYMAFNNKKLKSNKDELRAGMQKFQEMVSMIPGISTATHVEQLIAPYESLFFESEEGAQDEEPEAPASPDSEPGEGGEEQQQQDPQERQEGQGKGEEESEEDQQQQQQQQNEGEGNGEGDGEGDGEDNKIEDFFQALELIAEEGRRISEIVDTRRSSQNNNRFGNLRDIMVDYVQKDLGFSLGTTKTEEANFFTPRPMDLKAAIIMLHHHNSNNLDVSNIELPYCSKDTFLSRANAMCLKVYNKYTPENGLSMQPKNKFTANLPKNLSTLELFKTFRNSFDSFEEEEEVLEAMKQAMEDHEILIDVIELLNVIRMFDMQMHYETSLQTHLDLYRDEDNKMTLKDIVAAIKYGEGNKYMNFKRVFGCVCTVDKLMIPEDVRFYNPLAKVEEDNKPIFTSADDVLDALHDLSEGTIQVYNREQDQFDIPFYIEFIDDLRDSIQRIVNQMYLDDPETFVDGLSELDICNFYIEFCELAKRMETEEQTIIEVGNSEAFRDFTKTVEDMKNVLEDLDND